MRKGLLFSLLLCTVILVGCKEVPTLTCRIIDGAEEGLILLADMESDSIYRISGKDVPIKGADALKDGMVIQVEHSGTMMLISPSVPADVTRIIVTNEPVSDMAGLCFQVVDDLWNSDTALSSKAETLGLDLSAFGGMTNSERYATGWRLGELHEIGVNTMTFDELVERGYIDGKNLSWENGVFFRMEGTAEKLNVRMWRDGTDTDCLTDGAYTEKNGVWRYSSGTFAVS